VKKEFVTTTLRTPKEIRVQLDNIAEMEERSLSFVMNKALAEFVEKYFRSGKGGGKTTQPSAPLD
jgi:predicted transcriptional regulator